MTKNMLRRRWTKALGIMVTLAMLVTGLSLSAAPAMAGTLTERSAQLSTAAASASSSATVSFKVTTTGTIATVDIALPQFAGTEPTVSGVSGLSAGTIDDSGTGASYKVTYTVTTPASVSASTTISMTVGGLTNPSSTGNQTVTITTKTSAPATIDSGTTLVTIVTNAAMSVSATVTEALTASIGTGSISLTVDPSATAFELASGYTVSVASNAKNGVTTKVSITGELTGTAYSATTISATTGTFASPDSSTGKPPVNTWGINADGTSNTWAGPTTGGVTVSGLTTASPTNAVNQSHVIGIFVDYTTAADTYTTTLKYVFTPNF